MKAIIAITLFFLAFNISAQKIFIYGTVKSVSGQAVIGSSILINDEIMAITDINGFYSMETTKKDSIVVKVKYLGFASQIKKLPIVADTIRYNLDFILKLEPFLLDEVYIEAKARSLFEKDDWTILDYIIDDNVIIVLATEVPKLYLYVFNLKGKLLIKKLLDQQYKNIIKSCLGGLHLIGDENCSEFIVKNSTIEIKNSYSRTLYDSFLASCIMGFDSIYIFKSYSDFNKNITFYCYNHDKSKKVLYEVFDKEAAYYARKDLNDIIASYYKTIFKMNNDSNSIKIADNIIERGEWNGDLEDLAITDDLMFKILWFKNVSTKKINAELTQINNKLFVVDFVNNEIINANFNNVDKKKKLIHVGKCKNPSLMIDPLKDDTYLTCDNYDIYEIKELENEIFINKIYEISSNIYHPKKKSIYNGVLYFMSYDNTKATYNKINKLKLY